MSYDRSVSAARPRTGATRRGLRTSIRGVIRAVAYLVPSGICLAQGLQVNGDASGRFEVALDTGGRISGLSAAQASKFRERVSGVADYLRSLDAVTRPPSSVCMRLSSFLVKSLQQNGTAGATVDAHIPIGMENGRCHRMTISGVAVYVNNDANLFTADNRVRGERDTYYYRLPIQSHDEQAVRMKDGTLVMPMNKGLPWRPVDRRSYLKEIVDYMEREAAQRERSSQMLDAMYAKEGRKIPVKRDAALRAEERQKAHLDRLREELQRDQRPGAVVCLDERNEVMTSDACPADRMLVEPNPEYWRRDRPDRIQLLVIATPPNRLMQESNEIYATRMAVFKALDLSKLRAAGEY